MLFGLVVYGLYFVLTHRAQQRAAATHLHAASAVRFTEGLAERLSAESCGP